MSEPVSTFISAKWIEPLWTKLRAIREKRRQELDEIGNVFGDPERLARLYVEPNCQHNNPADHDEMEPISFVLSPIFRTLDKFLSGKFVTHGDGRTQLFILSDAGMGKTSVLLMLKLMHLTSFWPKGHDCRLLKLGRSTLDDIREIKARANTVLLLDALDEDPSAWGRVAERIREILAATTEFRRVIISCRTQFFPDGSSNPHAEPGKVRVSGFTCPVLFLSLFDDSQIEEYLTKLFGRRWFEFWRSCNQEKRSKARELLQKMNSLRFRPLLLSYIEDLIESEVPVWNPYTINEMLLKRWLDREEVKYFKQTGEELRANDLEEACILIAVQMGKSELRTISETTINALRAEHKSLEALSVIDIGGRSLLNRTSDGAYRFAHFTIQEFLLVRGAIKMGSPDVNATRVTTEMALFAIYASCTGLEMHACLIRNLIRLSGIKDFRGLALKRADFDHCQLEGCDFGSADLKSSSFLGAYLGFARFHRAELECARFTDSSLRFADFREATCFGAFFDNADLLGADFRGAKVNSPPASPGSEFYQTGNFLCEADGVRFRGHSSVALEISRRLAVESNQDWHTLHLLWVLLHCHEDDILPILLGLDVDLASFERVCAESLQWESNQHPERGLFSNTLDELRKLPAVTPRILVWVGLAFAEGRAAEALRAVSGEFSAITVARGELASLERIMQAGDASRISDRPSPLHSNSPFLK